MTEVGYNPEAVESINSLLDEIELRPNRNQFVVIGGSALAAWGIRPLKYPPDLDIAVTNDLLKDLKGRSSWLDGELTPWVAQYFTNPPIIDERGMTIPLATAIEHPLGKNDVCRVESEELIAEGIPCGEAGYLYSPLFRILETKRALAGAPANRPIEVQRQQKHWQDVMLITRYVFENYVGSE